MARQTEFAQLIESIDDVPRDLAFHPSVVTEPEILTVDQVASYNANGYVKGVRVFDEAEMVAHRRYFDVDR